jgi:serine/threonine protein kinase
LKQVGTGAFGDVFMAIEPSINSDLLDKTYAVKVINRDKLPSRGLNTALSNEINALTGLHHPNIVHLKEVIDDPEAPLLYLVM